MRVLAIACLSLVLIGAAPAPDTFTEGAWKGRANFDPEGHFTDCTVLRPDPKATTIGFVMTLGANLGMLIADPSLKLKPGAQKPVLVQTVGQNPFAAMADVVADTAVLIPLKEDDAVFGAIRDGSGFRISMQGKELSLAPEGTGKALSALKTCVKNHEGNSRVPL